MFRKKYFIDNADSFLVHIKITATDKLTGVAKPDQSRQVPHHNIPPIIFIYSCLIQFNNFKKCNKTVNDMLL